jgi:hypothetical protein
MDALVSAGCWQLANYSTVCHIRHHMCMTVMRIQNRGKVKFTSAIASTHVPLDCEFVLSICDWHAFPCPIGFDFVKLAWTRLMYFIQINHIQ